MTSTESDTQKKTRQPEAEVVRSPSAAVLRGVGKPIAIATILVATFFVLQSRIPLRTAVQIGADEGFELAKATLCLKGYRLYSEVWNDQPPLHTWLITQAVRLQGNHPLTPAEKLATDRDAPSPLRSPSVGERESSELASVSSSDGERENYSPLGPRLVTVGFAALLLVSVFVMAFHVARQSGAGVSPVRAEGETGRKRTQGTQKEDEFFPPLRSVRSFAARLWTAALATALLMASPGFMELSSSCMMEIPALAPAVAALCVLLIGRQNAWHRREVVAGILFGIALGMKLLGVILLPLAGLILWVRWREAKSPLTPSDGERVSKGRVRGRWISRLTRTLSHFLTFAAVIVVTFVTLDLLIDRGAFLKHFQQTWVSHFAPPVSFDYGSPSDHRFPPGLLLKNWDLTLPALVGIVALLRRCWPQKNAKNTKGKRVLSVSAFCAPFRGSVTPLLVLPFAWLALMLAVFWMHTPWWSYYYIHIAIPLSWCAAVGYVSVWSAVLRGRQRTQRTQGKTLLALRSLRSFAALMIAFCAVAWMSARVHLQITGIRNSPQTYYSLVLKEIERFKPFTEWIYADNLTYSFHSGIPLPPQLAVVPLKRLWAGKMTTTGVGSEVRKFKPGLIALRNDTRELPFQDLLDTEYRLVYHTMPRTGFTRIAASPTKRINEGRKP